MDERLKHMLTKLGADVDANEQVKVDEGEHWDELRLTQAVAELCAQHGHGFACVFACGKADDFEGQVGAMLGGADVDCPTFSEMVMTLAGKLFNGRYNQHGHKQVVVTREKDDA